mgnify:CR=1 FL=1
MINFQFNDNKLQFSILNYQFPEGNNNEYDRNWLMINIIAKKNDLEWTKSDPSLLTWEVKEIINWFSLLSKNNNPKNKELTFIEPNIVFEYNKNENDYEIKIKFAFELLPNGWNQEKECFLIFKLSSSELKMISYEFKNELEKYPFRK